MKSSLRVIIGTELAEPPYAFTFAVASCPMYREPFAERMLYPEGQTSPAFW